MNNQKPEYLSQKMQMAQMKTLDCFPVPYVDWYYLRKKVVNIESPSSIIIALASSLSGGFFVTTLYQILDSDDKITSWCWIIFILSCIGLLIISSIAIGKDKSSKYNKEYILDDMSRIQNRFGKPYSPDLEFS